MSRHKGAGADINWSGLIRTWHSPRTHGAAAGHAAADEENVHLFFDYFRITESEFVTHVCLPKAGFETGKASSRLESILNPAATDR
jgi:hypothetical protein